MDEAETRRRLIDERLRLAGWDPDDPSQVTQELDIDLTGGAAPRTGEGRGPYSGHQFADYALLLHGRPAAVVEAKKASRDANLGREQALQYAQNIQQTRGGPLPFVFYTNGPDTHLWKAASTRRRGSTASPHGKNSSGWPSGGKRVGRFPSS